MDNIKAGGEQFVHCREVVHSSRVSIIRGSTVHLCMSTVSVKFLFLSFAFLNPQLCKQPIWCLSEGKKK